MKSTDTDSTDNRPMLFDNRPMSIRAIEVISVVRMDANIITGDTHA